MDNAAAIILAAGKGTRMGDAPINKVCFDCAGVPVIKRIVANMRAGGVTRFVIVVGHRAESVMSALDGEAGVLYAFQKEQKGTGHAAQCGLKVLESIGFDGPVIISVGDKIVAIPVIAGLLKSAHSARAVWGVQPARVNRSGGRIVEVGGKPKGVVELTDIGLMGVVGLPEAERAAKLDAYGLNAKKAAKVLALARKRPDFPTSRYGVSADEMLASRYSNASLYCFDTASIIRVLDGIRSDNAQGELYLTDALESFASEDAAVLYPVESADDMLTYSTRPELREISHRFLRRASEFQKSSSSTLLSPPTFYPLLLAFAERYGDRPCIITSAPGRVNLMGRHIDHRGGSTNVMTTEQRMTFVVAPREDDIVHIANLDPAFPEAEFRISDYLQNGATGVRALPSSTAAWLDFLETPAIKADLEATRGHWVNYIKSAVLRFQFAEDFPLCGMDIMASGDIPVAAGLSSSSALVVATAEAVVALNSLNVSTRTFIDYCGEGEWYVGSRGGAGDHAAMKCGREGRIVHLKFKPFEVGASYPFSGEYAIIVADSGEKAKKSEGAREAFNARIRDYETAFVEVKRHFPGLPVAYFRDLAFLPEADCEKALACLTGSVRGVAQYGVDECRRAEEITSLLATGDYVSVGRMFKASHDGDRVGAGLYECSTKKIDALCDELNRQPGVLGSQIVGAGLGGSFIALVKREAVEETLAFLKGKGIAAVASKPSRGSEVRFGSAAR